MNAHAPEQKHDARFVVWALLWTVGTRYGGKFVNLLTTIVLAWLLTQEEFGLAGYALIFVAFIEILEGFGVESALVYHAEDEELRNNAFWISAAVGVLVALTVFLAAPLAAIVFDDERATPLVQLLSLAFVFTGLRIVPKAILVRRMQFKLLAVPEFVKVGVKGVAAIALALGGAGAWSLIASVVLALAAELVALWLVARWWPSFRFVFRAEKIRPLLSYGGGLIGLSAVGTLIANIDYVLVGRLLGASALGAYMIGFRLPTLLVMPLVSSLSKVLFPLSVHKRSDPAAMVDGWKHALRYTAIIITPIGVGIACTSHMLVPVLFGEKWIESVPVVAGIALQTVMISLMWHTGDIYKATGQIRLLFRLAVLQLAITAPLLVAAVTLHGTIGAVAGAHVVAAALTMVIRLWVMTETVPVSKRDIAALLAHPLLAAALMAAVVLLFDHRLMAGAGSDLTRLLLGVAVGAITYAVLTFLLMRDELDTGISQLKQTLARQS